MKRPHILTSIKREIWTQPCAVCGSRKNVFVDHIIPVAKGGTNDRSNLQPLCRRCNNTKGARLTTEELRKKCWWRPDWVAEQVALRGGPSA